jgi:methylated-DNA-[protein]-cysteine S-methyltransferase
MTGYAATVETPDGPFTLVADGGAVIASGWTDDPGVLLAGVHPSLRPADWIRVGAADCDADPALAAGVAAVAAYYAGSFDAVAEVPLRTKGSPFKQAAWAALREVPAGETVSYGELAALAGRPRAARAGGGACATNPTALFVPCHRVVKSDGGIGGFGYRPELKAALLAREGVAAR